MRLKIFYIIFAISALLYANARVFLGLSPRHIMSFVMFAVCLYEEKKVYMDRWLRIYLLFILGFTISSIITGYTNLLPRYLLGFYFVAYVACWATSLIVCKYNGIQFVISILIIIGLVDVAVTIGQFYNLPVFSAIPSMLGIKVDAEVVNYLERMDEGVEAYGIVIPGLFASNVYNGYFLMSMGVCSLSLLRHGLSLLQIYRLLPWFLFVLASYMVQERGPFYLLLIVSVYILFKLINVGSSKWRWLYFLAMAIILPFVASSVFNFLLSGNSRYNMGFEGTNRDSIYAHSIDYISENFIFGGIFKLFDIRGFAPHNLLLNAWIYGGIIGFISIVWLTWKQCVMAIKIAFSRVKKHSIQALVLSLAFLCFTLNSMLHNVSVVTGDTLVWMLWTGFYFSNEKYRSNIK